MCGRVLYSDEEDICASCQTQLPRTEHASHRDNRTEQLFAGDDKLVRAGSFCYYPPEHPYRNAIREMKFYARPEIGQQLGRMAAEEWRGSGFFDGIDYLVPLPLHRKRLHKRGYNQAEYIARGISQVTGIPIATKLLARRENNAQQSRKSLDERKQLPQIFLVKDPAALRGKTVLLIDDVITSGSTMRRVTELLHAIPKCRYVIFSLALAKGDSHGETPIGLYFGGSLPV